MSYYTYIIKSVKTGGYYIGSSENVEKRLHQHNNGKTKSTKNGIPWEIIAVEKFDTRLEAIRRELKIKSYKGGNAFKNLIIDIV